MKKKIAALLLVIMIIIPYAGMNVSAADALLMTGGSTGLLIGMTDQLIDMTNIVPGDSQENLLYIYNTDPDDYYLWVQVIDRHPDMEDDYKLLDPYWTEVPTNVRDIEYPQAANPEDDPYWGGLDRDLEYPIQILVYMDITSNTDTGIEEILLADFPAKGPGSIADLPATYPDGYYLLGRVPSGGAARLRVEVNFIELHMEQNPYQGKAAELEWRFIAEIADPVIPTGVTRPTVAPTTLAPTVSTEDTTEELVDGPSDETVPLATGDITDPPTTEPEIPATAGPGDTEGTTDEIVDLTNIEPPDIPKGVLPEMPQTGEVPLWYSFLLGGFIVLLGIWVLWGVKRKDKGDKKRRVPDDMPDE